SKATRVPGLQLQYPGETKKGAARPTGCASDHGDTNPPPIGTVGSAGKMLTPDEIPVPGHTVTRESVDGPPLQTGAAKVACIQTNRSGFGQSASQLPQRLSAVENCDWPSTDSAGSCDKSKTVRLKTPRLVLTGVLACSAASHCQLICSD